MEDNQFENPGGVEGNSPESMPPFPGQGNRCAYDSAFASGPSGTAGASGATNSTGPFGATGMPRAAYVPGHYPPMGYYAPPKGSGCIGAGLKFILGLVGLFLLFMFLCIVTCALIGSVVQVDTVTSGVLEKTLSGRAASPHKVVILPVEGMIEGKEDGFIRKAIRQAEDDPRVSALVLRVNSPGGTMSGSDYYYSLLKKLKTKRNIPVVVSMGGLAASGGYYISMVGDEIFAERSTLTGSIGVIIPLYNAAGLCEKIGFASSAVTSGPMKGMGDFSKPMSPAEKAIWQGLVDDSYELFLSVVREGRPIFADKKAADAGKDKTDKQAADAGKDKTDKQAADAGKDRDKTDKQAADAGKDRDKTDKQAADAKGQKETKAPADLRKIADGRIYTSKQAMALGLIDKIGFLNDAVNRAMELANITRDDTQVVRYKTPGGLAAVFSEAETSGKTNDVARTIGDITEPRVWVICPQTAPLGKEK